MTGRPPRGGGSPEGARFTGGVFEAGGLMIDEIGRAHV